MKVITQISVIIIIVIIIVIVGLGIYYAGEAPLKKSAQTEKLVPKQSLLHLFCQSSNCIQLQEGQVVGFFLASCRVVNGGWGDDYYQVTWCPDTDPRCQYQVCEPPSTEPEPNPDGGHPPACKTAQDCPGGEACVNARIVDSKVVIDGGTCVLGRKAPADKAIGGPFVQFTCVCTPQ